MRTNRRARVLLLVVVTAMGVLSLTTRASFAVEFCNTTPIVGNGNVPPPLPSNPYPSTINVSGLTGTITDVNVRLLDIDTRPDGGGLHWAEDLDVMLVAPDSSNVILMSDAGGNNSESSGPVTNVNLTLDDQAANPLPADTALTSGTFRPVNDDDVDPQITPDDQWPAPAPAPSGSTALSTFNGKAPNGTWSLFAVDDYGQSAVDINGGWCIDIITTSSPTTTGGPTTTSGPTTTTAPTTTTTAPTTTTTAPTTTTTAPTTTTTAPTTTTTAPTTTTTAPTTTTTAPTTTTTAPTTTTTTTVPPGVTCDGRAATLVGTSGADRLTGTAGPDVIVGGGGDDQIVGLGGDDIICGGAGNDQLIGGDGNDRLFGEAGSDYIVGDNGNDVFDGGSETDQCHGGAGTDSAVACESTSGVP